MTAQEFKAWIAGFLDGKETLSAEQVCRIRDEAAITTAEWHTNSHLYAITVAMDFVRSDSAKYTHLLT